MKGNTGILHTRYFLLHPSNNAFFSFIFFLFLSIFRGQAENILSLDEDIAPSPLARYHRLLFAVLKLCLAIISSVGVENSNIAKEVKLFFSSNLKLLFYFSNLFYKLITL